MQRRNKLSPAYEGPYTVVRETKGGSYVLMDEQGLLMPRDFPPSHLKLISQDEIVSLDEIRQEGQNWYTVQGVVGHRELGRGKYLYRVRWEGYDKDEDSWLSPDDFSSPQPIADYWAKLGTITPKKTAAEKQPAKLSNSRSTSKRGTVSRPTMQTRSSNKNKQVRTRR